MTKGKCENFFKYRVDEPDKKSKYFKMINDIRQEYGIGKNTVYNIINKTRNITKSKVALNISIHKIRIPAHKVVEIAY